MAENGTMNSTSLLVQNAADLLQPVTTEKPRCARIAQAESCSLCEKLKVEIGLEGVGEEHLPKDFT
jgi:hypothetical protein